MKSLKESEIAKSYKGKAFIPEKLRKIAMGSGNTRAVVFSRRITQSQGALIGITDEIFNKWWDDDIYLSFYIDLIEPDNIIEDCGIQMIKNADPDFIEIDPTEQELEILQNIMNFITIE